MSWGRRKGVLGRGEAGGGAGRGAGRGGVRRGEAGGGAGRGGAGRGKAGEKGVVTPNSTVVRAASSYWVVTAVYSTVRTGVTTP